MIKVFMEEEKKEGEIKDKNIGLVLDSYQDLFSDFDPRDFSQRTISDDFLVECKKATRDREDHFELKFLLPNAKRNFRDELKIKKRLKLHFQKHFHEKENEIKKEGFIWVIIGAILMLGSTYLYDKKEFIMRFLLIVLEPAGWFLVWEGLYNALIYTREKNPELHFYRKMANAQINFNDYVRD